MNFPKSARLPSSGPQVLAPQVCVPPVFSLEMTRRLCRRGIFEDVPAKVLFLKK